jgi:hypothetical protein
MLLSRAQRSTDGVVVREREERRGEEVHSDEGLYVFRIVLETKVGQRQQRVPAALLFEGLVCVKRPLGSPRLAGNDL